MLIIETKRILGAIQIFMVTAFALSVISCGGGGDGDAGSSQKADPNNCEFPCLKNAPFLDITTVIAGDGDTITMTLDIEGDASLIEIPSSFFTLEPVDTSSGQGRLATGINGVVTITPVGSTVMVNFVIPGGTVTGDFYPKLSIGVAGTPDPNDPGTGWPNSVEYELQVDTSTVNYSYSEVIVGESTTYSSNGNYLGYVDSGLVMPIVTLQ